MVGFRVYSTSGVQFDLVLVLRSQFFEYLREALYKHALEHLEAGLILKKKVPFFFLPTVNECLTTIDLYEGL